MEAPREKREVMSEDLLAILDRIELIVKQFVTAGSQAAIYVPDHPAAREYIERAYETVKEILTRKASFAVSVREEMLIYENIPLYRLSITARKFIDLLKGRRIHGMIIRRDVTVEEIAAFIGVLVAPPGTLQGREEVNRELARRGVRRVEAIELPEEEEWIARPAREIYKDAVHLMRAIGHSVYTGKRFDTGEVAALAGEIAQAASADPNAMIGLASIKGRDEDLFNHSANVSVLATSLASLFFKEKAALQRLAQAALLHDIGKLLIPPEILAKAGPLDEREMGIVRRHPVDGARMLEESEGADRLAVVVAFEHHMGYDMKGYPAAEGIAKPHPMSLAVQIANVYDAMTSNRTYRPARAPAAALSQMLAGAGTVFEPRLLRAFAGLMGAYPPELA